MAFFFGIIILLALMVYGDDLGPFFDSFKIYGLIILIFALLFILGYFLYKFVKYQGIKDLAITRRNIGENFLIKECGLSAKEAAKVHKKLLRKFPEKQNTEPVVQYWLQKENSFPNSSICYQNRDSYLVTESFVQPMPVEDPSAASRRKETELAVREHAAYVEYMEEHAGSRNRQNQYSDSPNIYEIDNMNGWQFEEMITTLFTKMGYVANRTKMTGDQGVDVIARRDNEILAIQAKCYTSQNVGNKAVQEVYTGMSYYGANDAYVITNQYFTKSAQELAHRIGVSLWDRDALEVAIKKYML